MGPEERIERLCRRYAQGELTSFVAKAHATPILDRILDAVRAGGAALETVEADLDLLEAAMVDAQLEGLTVPRRAYKVVLDTPGHPVVFTWNCPRHACSRTEPAPAFGGTAPTCAIAGQSLDRKRLQT